MAANDTPTTPTTRDITVGKLKTDLRFSHTALNTDLSDQVDECLADLTICGVVSPRETDPIVLNAIKLWCRINYSDDTVDADRYQARYDKLKACLMMAAGYGGDLDAD